MAHECWSEPYTCSNFIDYIVSRQQLPLATSIICDYIDNNNLYEAPFKHIEDDIQYNNDSQIKQYLTKQVANKLTAQAIFIDICALIEAAPITNNQYNMMFIQFTRITFDRFSMKDRRKCMKYIIISCNFDDAMHGLYTDLLEYDKHQNMSDVMDYLYDNSNDNTAICNDTNEVEEWLYFLKKAIAEYAYHAPIDAIVFIKELRIDFKRYNIYDYDHNLHTLETYLLKHCSLHDDDKEEEQNTNNKNNINSFVNTFDWLKNDIYNAVGNDMIVDKIIKISEIKQIINDEEFIQQLFFCCSEICFIQNSDFRRLFIESQDNLNVFRFANRIKCAQYIVTKYLRPAQARNDKNTLINDLLRINMDDKVSDLIFGNDSDDDMKENNKNKNKLFTRNEECLQFINTLFPIETLTNINRLNNMKAKEYKEEPWTESECTRLLKRCIKIKGTISGDWMNNSVIIHSKLHPNLAFNLSVIDIRYAVYQKVNNPSKRMDKHELSEKFGKYLQRYHCEIDLGHLGQGLSDFVTNRYLPYIPVIVALLNIKLPDGSCYMTQTALLEISFRISDIMIAFKQVDIDKIIHVDLLIFYNQHKWLKLTHKLKRKFTYNAKTTHFYPNLFHQITQKITNFSDAKKCVVRIFMLLNDKTPKIMVQFDTLNELVTKNDIDKKINNKKNPIYLPHVLEAWQRYQNLLLEKHENAKKKCSFYEKCKNIKSKIQNKAEIKHDNSYDDTESDDDDGIQYNNYQAPKCFDKIEYFQYSLIIFPKILNDDESRVYTTKQLLCIGNGILPFKRKDIINLLPRMFVKRDIKRLSMNFIENMEREYGNTGTAHRKQFFYDEKYDHIKELFDALKMSKKK